MRTARECTTLAGGTLLLAVFFVAVIMTGAVDISPGEIFNTLAGKELEREYVRTIILETRLPMALAAVCCGAMLSVAGLMMQTLFCNPLAGPSVLGISSGASFGVALLMLGAGGLGIMAEGATQPLLTTGSALLGGLASIAVLYIFSSVLKSGVTLLIVGIMISYLCSSGISLLNYFAPADEIRNYLMWGLGSFNGLRLHTSIWLLCLSVLSLIPTFLFIKPLNSMLLGETHLESVGYSIRKVRGVILLFTGLLVAVPAAFCGPIGFIGLVVPHICRLLLRSSNHFILLPGCLVFGASVSLMCAWLSVVPSATFGVLPVNVITPLIGVPVILYLLVNRHRLPYFS